MEEANKSAKEAKKAIYMPGVTTTRIPYTD